MPAEFIDIEAKSALNMLNKAYEKMSDTTPLMRGIAGILMHAVEENFAEQGRPAWVDLKEKTKEVRRKQNKWPGKILQVSGQLASSIQPHVSKDEAAVGTNKIYAATHQFGDPGRNIPARPFLTLGEDDLKEIENLAADYIDL